MGRLALADDAVQRRDWFIVVGRRIYVCRRVNTDALRLIGFGTLEGAAAVKTVEDQIAAERRQLQDLHGLQGEARETKAAEMMQRLNALQAQRFAAMQSTPEQRAEYLKRCNAYICASVHRFGAVLPEATFPGPIDVLAEGAAPATVAVDLRSEEEVAAGATPIYAEPLRFVEDERQHDPANGVVWLHNLPTAHRELLGTAIITLHHQATVGEVLPFRPTPRDRGDVPRAGEDVRQVAPRGAGADTGADGLRSVGAGRRKPARGGASRAGKVQGVR